MTRLRWRRLVPWPVAVLISIAAIGSTSHFAEPPRYDGAGYALLGRALAEGRGYRDIGEPAARRHAHFPPGYPAVLAVVWKTVGTDQREGFTRRAHLLSLLFVVGGVWLFGRWWLRNESAGVASSLTLALALNWTWVRTGTVIRSEPLALALGGLALLLARRVGSPRARPWLDGSALVVVLGLSVLTRQVMACWALAVVVDLTLQRGWQIGCSLLVGVTAVVAPWTVWQVQAGSGTQTGLFRGAGLLDLVGSQVLFYARRIPDSIAGPFVEVATVFGRSAGFGVVATTAAVGVTMVVILGWVGLVRAPRRRLGGLVPLATLPLLLVWPFTEAGRFLIPLVPFILMGAVEGGSALLGGLNVPRARLWASRLVLAASIPYSVYAIMGQRAAAERRTQRDFDAACAWLATQTRPEGPVMARHPGDVAWLTGRLAVGIPDGGRDRIAAAIARDRVAFVVVDDERYARSAPNPLQTLVADPERLRPVWNEGGSTAIYQVIGAASGAPAP